ncbi:hypothetical protein O1611_g9953 [Lasiodiplodia mahajangana]|uniref:Uncharacterized protein n=1 Tax=Lasiodiplodia mahajangana TaxID=1108764 RepID=A0ACC2J495_9PEZI|nr:hypothetical protein O1611_g9953 [Lasiodiplodia mahajangana]
MGVGNKRTLTKTRRKTRDLDQIKADLLSPKHLSQHKDTKSKEDLPGLGRWYCIECAKWYDTEVNLVMHRKGKPHKRRVKQLREEPYTQKEAEAAAGLGTSNEDPHQAGKTAGNEIEMAI